MGRTASEVLKQNHISLDVRTETCTWTDADEQPAVKNNQACIQGNASKVDQQQ